MEITDSLEKIEVIRRYLAAKPNVSGELAIPTNCPSRVTLRISGEEYTFSLNGSESVRVLSEFGRKISDLLPPDGP
jgi:hypothetical protein